MARRARVGVIGPAASHLLAAARLHVVAHLLTVALAAPQQLHLSLTGRTGEVAVDFVTAANASNACRFGANASALTSTAPATVVAFSGGGWTAFMNAALLAPLAPRTPYFYSCGSAAEGWSAPTRFVNEPGRTGGDVYAIWADFGYENAKSLPAILAAAAAGSYDYIIHAGAYVEVHHCETV